MHLLILGTVKEALETEQMRLFAPMVVLDRFSPCFGGDEVIQTEYMRGKTRHEWCQRHYVGSYANGHIRRCDCPCHQKEKGK